MGRTKGSKNKPKIEYVQPVSAEAAVAMYNAEHPNQFTTVETIPVCEFEEKYGRAAKEHFNDVANGRDEEPLPKNWHEMGKLDRLKWLTEHKR